MKVFFAFGDPTRVGERLAASPQGQRVSVFDFKS